MVFAPTAFYWYPYLESLFPGTDDNMMILYKLLMDQFIYSPLLLCSFWFHATFISTFDINKSVSAISQNVMGSLISNWCYWPFVQIINIGYMPDQYKVLVINFASIPWNMYVSYSVSQSNKTKNETKSGSKAKPAGKKKKKKKKKEM